MEPEHQNGRELVYGEDDGRKDEPVDVEVSGEEEDECRRPEQGKDDGGNQHSSIQTKYSFP